MVFGANEDAGSDWPTIERMLLSSTKKVFYRSIEAQLYRRYGIGNSTFFSAKPFIFHRMYVFHRKKRGSQLQLANLRQIFACEICYFARSGANVTGRLAHPARVKSSRAGRC